jgi:hypothetical protein
MKKDQSAQLPIIGQLKSYLSTRVRLAKYQAIEKGTSVAADIIADTVLIFCFILTFVFASVTLAFFLAEILGTNWEGFGCVTLLYLFVTVGVMIFKKNLERPVINMLIKKLLK